MFSSGYHFLDLSVQGIRAISLGGHALVDRRSEMVVSQLFDCCDSGRRIARS